MHEIVWAVAEGADPKGQSLELWDGGGVRVSFVDIPGLDIVNVRPLSGGDTCQAFEVTASGGERYFVKQASSFPGMMEAEARGLQLMGEVPGVLVPRVYEVSSSSLVLEFVEPNHRGMRELGKSLAVLHQKKADSFGLDFDNYIGQSPQKNGPMSDDWPEFYWDHRLMRQIRLGRQRGRSMEDIEAALVKAKPLVFEWLVDGGAPSEGASLLHGDLWGGNVLHGYFIDPAPYFGHRETDLAMTQLFGGFSPDFYRAYDEEYPLLDTYHLREPLYQLYHVLNHYTIFGGGYGQQALAILKNLL